MTEHLAASTIELLVQRRLAAEDLLTATRHLEICDECQQKAAAVKGLTGSTVRQMLADLQPADVVQHHLDYELFEAYVDNSLSATEQERVKKHLDSCAVCLQEVRELELLKENLPTYPAIGAQSVAVKQPENFWTRLAAFLHQRPAQLALLAAAIILMVTVALLIRRPAPQQTANTNSQPVNSGTNVQVATGNDNLANTNQPGHNENNELTAASAYDGVIKQALESQKVSSPNALRDLVGRQSKLLGAAESSVRFDLVSPVATLVRSTRPSFRWQSVAGAQSYTVAILDQDLNLIEKSSPLTQSSWTATHALKRNVVYLWQVTAVKDGQEITAPAAPAREARFKVLAADRETALTKVPNEISASPLRLGIIYAHEGLLDDAEAEFRRSIAQNQDTDVARKLLQSTRQLRK